MKKSLLALCYLVLAVSTTSAQVIITEIMYNPPEAGEDFAEYLELYNTSDEAVDLEGWSFDAGIALDNIGIVMAPQSYALIVKDSITAADTLLATVDRQWTSGSLSNGGERIAILDAAGTIVVDITFDDRDGWPSQSDGTDGAGASIVLCDLAADPSNGASWQASTNPTGTFRGGVEVLGSPRFANMCGNDDDPAELVLTELLYNDPSMDDDLEFLEIYNNDNRTINLAGYAFTDGIEHTFGDVDIAPGAAIVLARNAVVVESAFGISAMQWDAGGLLNSGETVALQDDQGREVFSVSYSDSAPWPTDGDGGGYSIVLCTVDQDNNDPSLWRRANEITSFEYDGQLIYSSPSFIGPCQLTIGDVTSNDMNGVPIYQDAFVDIEGIVHSINFRPQGLEFALIDDSGDGIVAFLLSENFGYDPMIGDSLRIQGSIQQFNGLTQISPVELAINGSGTVLEPRVVATLDESTEGELIQLMDMMIVNPVEWTGQGSGFNVRIANGMDTLSMRIDADVDGLYDGSYPQGTFDVTGIGYQFDPLAPFDEGYTIYPRFVADISPYDPFVEAYPAYPIPLLITEGASGIADSLNVRASITGIVYGENFRPSGLDFTVIDGDNAGMRIFNLDGDLGYTVQQGDQVIIKGRVDQRNGLTRMLPDSVLLLSTGNMEIQPLEVAAPSESTENSLIVTQDAVTWVDVTEWRGDGSSFGARVTNGIDTFQVFIDNDHELANDLTPPFEGMSFLVQGIGNQFDSDEPFDENYQIMVRTRDDFILNVSSIAESLQTLIDVFPTVTRDRVYIDTEVQIDRVEVIAGDGRVFSTLPLHGRWIDVESLSPGMFYLRVVSGSESITKKLIKL